MSKQNNWIWMPHPGHFICAKDCRYHLNTYVNGYIVSTLGEMWPDLAIRLIHATVHDNEWFNKYKHLKGDAFDSAYMKKFGYYQLAYDRKYESMVFKTKKNNSQCCPYVASSWVELDFQRYNDPDAATLGHYRLCERWDKKC